LLAIDSTEPNHFTEEDINIASKCANPVAVALENARLFEETQAQAITDPLTGVYNRRGLFGLGKVEFARSVRSNQPFSAIMLDLDHFKKINDAYGHAIGDLVLCETANRSKNCIREIDYLGRYGGEELVVLLPDTNLTASMIVAERLRMAIAHTPVRINEETKINITASLGVAGKDENTTSLEMLISHADQAMYAAKRKGRNRVVASP
ncbi:partial Response regulator PleD, partial [Anaerolineae bacterium]